MLIELHKAQTRHLHFGVFCSHWTGDLSRVYTASCLLIAIDRHKLSCHPSKNKQNWYGMDVHIDKFRHSWYITDQQRSAKGFFKQSLEWVEYATTVTSGIQTPLLQSCVLKQEWSRVTSKWSGLTRFQKYFNLTSSVHTALF